MTSKSQLTNIINQCCDILRTDDGISGAMHYTEALSWILFLKFIDDKEKVRKDQAELHGDDYHPLLKSEFQWSNWTNAKTGKTGKELIKWINERLIPELGKLKGAKDGDPKDIVSAIFRSVQNRVNSGFLLRDVIEKVQQIHFDAGDDAFSLSHIYEDLLRNMGEGGGNAGEYYTPRPLIKTIVQLIDPKIGDTIYDPACGTCGFLVQAHLYLEAKAKSADARKILNTKTFFGKEKTPLPYVLGLMNMMLHGVDYPRIEKKNTLQDNIREFDERDKYKIILANPPFGGKEQAAIQTNFPVESNATELLFLQHIEKSLKNDGRAAVVVPEGVLFQTNAAYQAVKKKLLSDGNLHTVVSLPAGVFLPYSAVKTSVIFLNKGKKSKDVWFYEVRIPDDKRLTKKSGITHEHFEDLLKKYEKRLISDNSWLIPVERVHTENCNLSAGHYSTNGPVPVDLHEPGQYAMEIKSLLAKAMVDVDALIKELKS